jgi:mannose-6-phosphate isomerase-like protein (cupin superfamily)
VSTVVLAWLRLGVRFVFAADSGSMEKVNLEAAFGSFDEHWSPRVAAELNDDALKLAKAEGEFVWHAHADANELFPVRSGELRIEFREADDVTLTAGELLVVPAGVEHRPVATEETELLLFEPTETANTGDVDSELTQRERRDLE